MSTSANRVETAVAAIKAGDIVIVTDDQRRENEGDLIMAAEAATPEKMRSSFSTRRASSVPH